MNSMMPSYQQVNHGGIIISMNVSFTVSQYIACRGSVVSDAIIIALIILYWFITQCYSFFAGFVDHRTTHQ